VINKQSQLVPELAAESISDLQTGTQVEFWSFSTLSPRLILPICLLIFANCGYDLSRRDSSLKANSQPANSQQANAEAVQVPAPANQEQENGPEAATSTSERAKLNAEEAALRHKALMRAHRKRIIETGKNDHAPTPEEYSPELELYKKPLRGSRFNPLRNKPCNQKGSHVIIRQFQASSQ
jgi:hypothetical protein